MKRAIFFTGLFAILLTNGSFSFAQPVFYQHDSSIKVYVGGQPQNLAWCGGFNNPQFSMGDLNNDGKIDLVVYDNMLGVRTFLNTGVAGNPHYIFAPQYAVNFPPILDYLTLGDINCDGIPDLFHRGLTGLEIYTGYYNSWNELCFTFKQDVYYVNVPAASGGFPVNVYVNPGDVPSLVDIDGDGALDFASYDIWGQTIYYYRNMRVVYGLPCDSIVFHLEDECWGKVKQEYYRTHLLQHDCSESDIGYLPTHRRHGVEKVTHSGNTPCLFDWDMDGDLDYLDGNVSFSNMTFLKNGKVDLGVAIDTMIYQDTLWQSEAGGKTIDIPMWPVAYNVDINQDGKKDLLVSPNAISSVGTASENYKCIWYYKNNSTTGTPNWSFQSDTFLIDQTIDVGTAAYPMLFDFNKDGKPDLFIGSDGYYQPGGSLQSKISYYQNTSTLGNPSFTLQTKDFLGLFSAGFQGAAPAFGDIDGDGISDMLIGHSDGSISYYKNMAASESVAPNWVLNQTILNDMNGTAINVGGYATPFVYDVDGDGKQDLVIGSLYGSFYYYQNVSTTPGVVRLKLINTNLGYVKVDPNVNYPNFSAPFIGKIDSTNTNYLLSGSYSGNIYRIGGIAGGDTAAVYSIMDTNYAYIDSQFSWYNHPSTMFGTYDGLRTSVTVGDIAGDGGLEMIVGNIRGGVELYKYKIYYPAHSSVIDNKNTRNGTVEIFPNPVSDLLNIKWHGLQGSEVSISVRNMEGQQLLHFNTNEKSEKLVLPISQLSNGMYFFVLQCGEDRFYNKFTVLR